MCNVVLPKIKNRDLQVLDHIHAVKEKNRYVQISESDGHSDQYHNANLFVWLQLIVGSDAQDP